MRLRNVPEVLADEAAEPRRATASKSAVADFGHFKWSKSDISDFDRA
jgi:hypothetical protein